MFVSPTDGRQPLVDETPYPDPVSVVRRGPFRALGAWAATAALLIGAAALLPAGFPLGRARGEGGVDRLISPDSFNRIFSVMIVFTVVAVVLGLAVGRRELGILPDRSRWAFGLLFGVALVGLVFLLAPLVTGLWERPTVAPSPAASPPTSPPGAPGQGVSSVLGVALTVALLGVLGGGIVTILWMTRSRRADRKTEEASNREERPSSEVIDPSAIPEPRMAVMAAYARMQRAVDSAGIERSASDAPLEVLTKVAEQRRAAWPSAGRLTGLFQRARFSQHPVDEAMRAAALSALAEARVHLEEASLNPPEGRQGSVT
jgi:hypothetical protein